MTIKDWITADRTQPIIYEGESIPEFVAMLRTIDWYPKFGWGPAREADFQHLLLARRIVGNPTGQRDVRPDADLLGYACGRTWSAEF
jgi:hypothetical protein